MHGLTQWLLTHVLSNEQSELVVHSGRQLKYGSPVYSGRHVHTPMLQTALDPHGEGWHKSSGDVSVNDSYISGIIYIFNLFIAEIKKNVSSYLFVVSKYSYWKDRLYNHRNMHKLPNGLGLYNPRSNHMTRGRGRHISHWYMLYRWHSPYWWYTLDGSLVGYPYIVANKSRKVNLQLLGTERKAHKEMVNKDLLAQPRQQLKNNGSYIFWSIFAVIFFFKLCWKISALPGISKQRLNGSPVNRGRHVQIGLWFITLHSVFWPHTPSQGFLHFWRIHACCWLHSELTRHSGRQAGGVPRNSDWQVHTAWSLDTLQILFGPHGDGMHGFLLITGKSEKVKVIMTLQNKNDYDNY